MDLGAYMQIGKLEQIMKDNGIEVPRLRGLRLMSEESPLSEEEIHDQIIDMARVAPSIVVRRQYEMFNKYCGRPDVLYIHARIGGPNWVTFGGPELAKQPWFIDAIDDAFDPTYCDIYAKIK